MKLGFGTAKSCLRPPTPHEPPSLTPQLPPGCKDSGKLHGDLVPCVGFGAGVPLPQGTLAAMSRDGPSPSPPSEALELRSVHGGRGKEGAVDRLQSPPWWVSHSRSFISGLFPLGPPSIPSEETFPSTGHLRERPLPETEHTPCLLGAPRPS